MKQFEKKLSLKKPASIMPLLRKHAADIMSETFKGTKLVPGWFVVSSEITSDKKGNRTELSTWHVREHHDVESDLKAFLADVLESFEKRVAGCTKEIQNVLTCLDLDTIFGLLCGERLPNGKVKLANGEEVLELFMEGKISNDFIPMFVLFRTLWILQLMKNFSSTQPLETQSFIA